MPKKVVKSKVSQALDQISIDWAEGSYLNTLTANFGLERPAAGFSDDEWRAIAKLIQLQEKTPTQKIIAALEVVLGPSSPFGTSLAAPVSVGDTEIQLQDTTGLPQVGSLYLDFGKASQEKLNYKLVDYTTNTVILSTAATQAHSASTFPYPCYVLSRAAVNQLAVPYADHVVVGDSVLAYSKNFSEVCTVTAKNVTAGTVTVSRTVGTQFPSNIDSASFALTSAAYQIGSFDIPVTSVSKFESSGIVQIIPAAGASTFAASAGSTTSSIVSSGLEDSSLSGYKLKFTGNVTAALANKIATVITNTATSITLDGPLSNAPAAGDTFVIIPVVEYTAINFTGNSITVRRPLSSSVSLPSGSRVELIQDVLQLKDCTVYVPSGGWKFYQADNRNIYIKLLPSSNLQNQFSASYVSTYPVGVYPSTTSTSFSGNTLTVASTAGFPTAGVLRYQPAGVDLHLGYYVSSATTFTIPYPPTGVGAIVSGQPVTLHGPVYTGTNVRDGNFLFNVGNGAKYPSWLGPYVIKQGYLPAVLSQATLAQNIAGPTTLETSVSYSAVPTVLEVTDAVYAPLTGTYFVRVGLEQFTVTRTTLRSVAKATVAGSGYAAGVTSISATNTGVNATLGGAFPNATNYRIVLSPNTVNEEIAVVTGLTVGGTAVFTLASPTLKPHNAGDSIYLAADCLTVNQVDSTHIGKNSSLLPTSQPHANPFSMYTGANTPEKVEFLYSSINVTLAGDIAGWNSGTIRLSRTGVPKVYLNGTGTAGGSSLSVDSTNNLPAAPFKLAVGDLQNRGAVHGVSAKASNSLTLAFPLEYAHTAETCVYYGEKEETQDFSSVLGATINFASPTAFSSDHSIGTLIYRTNSSVLSAYVGTNFSLRLPADFREKLSFILDLVKAAGVKINFV